VIVTADVKRRDVVPRSPDEYVSPFVDGRGKMSPEWRAAVEAAKTNRSDEVLTEQEDDQAMISARQDGYGTVT
jgi:hypothetical protein